MTTLFASYHIAPAQTPHSGVELLRARAAFADPGRIADAFLALFWWAWGWGWCVWRDRNIAACIGLHAGWVWVMLVVHSSACPCAARRWVPAEPLRHSSAGWCWTAALGPVVVVPPALQPLGFSD
jgi:hypothetical protein